VKCAPICVKYTVTRGVYLFLFILPDPYSLNGNSHLDHNASIDADFLKEVPLGVSKFAKKNLGVIIAPQDWKKLLNCCKSMKFLKNC
jgi:hypothetical protein